MVASFLITLREGLEAALIVGIVLGVLRKLGYASRGRAVWTGVLAAVVASIAMASRSDDLPLAFGPTSRNPRRSSPSRNRR